MVLLDYRFANAKHWSNLPQSLLTRGGQSSSRRGPRLLGVRLGQANPVADAADRIGTAAVPVVLSLWSRRWCSG